METLHSNTSAFTKYRLRPRVLVDVSRTSTQTHIFSSPHPIALPLGISPAGLQAMAHHSGELATSRAAATHDIPMAISSFSNHSISSVRAAGLSVNPNIPHAIQLYSMRDRALQERIVRSAEAAGATAIFLTADSPVLGVRYNEWRNDFRTPVHLSFPIIELTSEKIQAQTHDSGFMAFNSDSHSWAKEIPWLRSITKMQIYIKGVLTAEDTLLAIKYGCDGIIVSNHGGRQLDGVAATLDALPECVAAAAGHIPVHIDGGFRRGSDIFKAVALGAQCVWVGRPAIWGLAYDGEEGVKEMIGILMEEFRRCMQLTGCKVVGDITRERLALVGGDGRLSRL